MNKIIELDNDYFLEVVDKENEIDELAINVQEINKTIIKDNKVFLLKIDFETINREDYKKILKRLLNIKNYAKKSKINLGKKSEIKEVEMKKSGTESNLKIQIGFLLNYDENNKNHIEFISAINAILYDNKFQRYNYIYDTVCDYLDNFFYGKNLCDFKENQCGEKRGTTSRIGCCHHFKVKWLGPFTKLVPCEHLKEDYTCGAKCIGCKLFTCDYLEKKGVKFRIKDILLLDTFFNPVQKYFIKFMVFTPKEKIIKRLMRTGA